MMNGYVGRFILLNGKDLYGNRWPLLYFNNFGDFPPILPMYLSGLFTFILGVTPFAIRFPIAIIGSLAIFPTYFLARKVFRRERYAFASAFFLAILPWHIVLSRATAENITATCVFLLTTLFLLQYWKTRRLAYFGALVALTGLLYFLYASFRVTTPLFFFGSIFLARDKKWRLYSNN
jgi:4-amino-4-deoxy-L-arabinose transferase-like glycosyltransferase